MYRIYFDPKTSTFVIQILMCNVLWRNAKGMSFATYDEAQRKVAEVGLDKLYTNKSADQYRDYMQRAIIG